MKKLHIIAAVLLCQILSAQNWTYLPGTTDYPIFNFYNDTASGKLLAVGSFDSAGTVRAPGIAAWNGSVWASLGLPSFSQGPYFSSITRFNGDLYLGGGFPNWNAYDPYVVRWNGSTLDSIGHFTVGGGDGLLPYHDSIISYSHFDVGTVNGMPYNSVASWDGTNWHDLGHGALEGSVFDMVNYHDMLYCSTFSNVDHLLYVFRYVGNNWQPVGSNFYGTITTLCVYNNELYAGGYHNPSNPQNAIMKLDTLTDTWVIPGGGVSSSWIAPHSSIQRMCVHNNALYAVGVFDHAGGAPAVVVAKWDGTDWCGLGLDSNTDANNCVTYANDLYLATGNIFDNASSAGFVKWIGGNYVDQCGNTTGISETENENQFSVFPNPATDHITIQSKNISGSVSIQLCDMLGQTILERKEENNLGGLDAEIDVSKLPNGIYFIRIADRYGKSRMEKIIIQR